MPSRDWNNDDELIGDLRAALRPIPAEPGVVDAAWAAFAWRSDPSVELAELVHDSLLDAGAAVRAPHDGSPRTLAFGRGPLQVEIEMTDGGIEGQLVPPTPGTVRLVTLAGEVAATQADTVGCFSFTAPVEKPFRLSCTSAVGHIDTEWITT